MPIDWGPVIIAMKKIVSKSLLMVTTKAADGTRGGTVQRKAKEGEIGVIEDELVGKIGPVIGVYDAEAANRVIGEWYG